MDLINIVNVKSPNITILIITLFFFSQFSYAIISGESFKIVVSEILDVGNSSGSKKSEGYELTGLGYALMGSVVSIGAIPLAGASYSAIMGVLTSYRPAQDNVSTTYVFPNPCNLKKGCNGVNFTRLTLKCEIKIYTISGEHIITISKNSNSDSQGWDLKTKNGNYVASGLYIYYIIGSDGSTKRGKLVVVR